MIDLAEAKLVAGREIREQLRGRALWISTVIIVIAVALLVGVLVDRAFAPDSTARTPLAAEAIARAVSVAKAIESSGVPAGVVHRLTNPTPLTIEHLRPAPASIGQRGVALATAIIFFLLVMRYGIGLLMGVVQEKATRVIEILLSTLRPVDLLAGKLVGSSAIALAQAAIIAVTVLVSAAAVGSDILKTAGAGAIGVAFVWVVLGYLLYAALSTAAGALASKAEDAQAVSLPLQIRLFIGYFVSFATLGGGPPSAFVRVLAYIPFTASMDMPVLAASGGARAWQIGVSMAIMVVAIVATMRISAVLFSRSILRTDRRLKMRDVLREGRRKEAAAT